MSSSYIFKFFFSSYIQIFLVEKLMNLFFKCEGGEDPNGFAPSFVEKPRIIPNEAGTLITMKCRCKSKPAPVVTWYREKDVVQETSKIKIKSTSTEEDIYELVLEIKVKRNGYVNG